MIDLNTIINIPDKTDSKIELEHVQESKTDAMEIESTTLHDVKPTLHTPINNVNSNTISSNKKVKSNVKSKEISSNYYKTIAGRLKKKKEKKFSLNITKLTNAEMLEIIPIDIEDDFLVPPEIAAKIKDISIQAIYRAINNGGLKVLKGILLSSLVEYKTNKKKGKGE